MTQSVLRDRAIREVVAAIGGGSVWAGYRFVEQGLDAFEEVALAGEAARRYRYWMGWASEELAGGEAGEARSSLVDARVVQLEALAALEDTLHVARGLAPEVGGLRLFEWDGVGVIYLVDHAAHGEVLLEVARSALNDHGSPTVVFSGHPGSLATTSPSGLVDGAAQLLKRCAGVSVLPRSLARGARGGRGYHVFEHLGGEPLEGRYAAREPLASEPFDALARALVDEAPVNVGVAGGLALDPGTVAARDGELVVWRVRGVYGHFRAVHPHYSPRWPANPAYGLLAMRHELGDQCARIYATYTPRQHARFTLDAALAAEVERADPGHPIAHLARMAIPTGEQGADLRAALGVSHDDGVLRDAPVRSLIDLAPPPPLRVDIFTRYVREEPSQEDALEKGMTWGRRVGTGERVLIAQVPGEDDPGSRAARLYADALRLEAGALARCDGAAGLLRVLERGEDALGRPVAVFAPAGGVPLSALLEERGRLTFEDARAIALQACGALDALHREGCVHANVKPRTILVERVEGSYRATLRFSGIAMPNGPRPDTGGIVFGTTGYMAPEQIMSEKAMGPRADLFSLACTLLECLTGQPAFSPELREFFGAVTRSPAGVTALGALGAVHPSLRIVLERALQASPDMRQRTCADFARELAALGEARPRRPVDPPPPSPEDARRPGPLRVRPPLPPASRTSPGGGRTIAARYRIGEVRRRDGVYTSYEGFDLVAREPVEVAIFELAASYGGTVSVSALVDHLHALYDRPRQRVQRVRDLGELDSGGVYVVMDDLGELPTLWELMDRGPMRYQTSRGVLAGAAAALDAIQDLRHEVVHPGLIHVIVREDHSSDIVLSGVDLCEVCLENEDPELNTYPAGLFQYMAPEVLQGGARRTPASAVWNLGVLAYLLETNQLPFGQGAAMHVLERVMTARPKPFASFIVGGHDHAVEEAVFRCLARDPADRHASIADAARALGFEGF